MVKGLVFTGPRGYNMLAEVDYFYPLPDSLDALKPKKTKLKAVPTVPPPPPTTEPAPLPFVDDQENHILFNHGYEQQPHPGLFVPDSGWKNDPNLAHLPDVPLGKEVLTDRVWSQPGSTVRKL